MWKVCTLLLFCSLVLQSMASSDKHDCSTHQEHITCGSACPANCANYAYQANLVCTKQCISGCFCKYPYIFKQGNSGDCVLFQNCPKRFLPY
ncbi:chymotrypsin-elastase inhibitor ixodidin-like [Engystomops pustulosus]|uniref:chymotrypsin-elastase inhibitor ixodidin-like n=1 Tax=Engystomops pustulosus TaxID=76066 RepID=UPI003AFA902A